jgi:carbamate kinase
VRTAIAPGGNARSRAGEEGTAAEQRANLRGTVPALAPLLEGRAGRHPRERAAGRQRAPARRARCRGDAAALARGRADVGGVPKVEAAARFARAGGAALIASAAALGDALAGRSGTLVEA